jgi:hypothetical protein
VRGKTSEGWEVQDVQAALDSIEQLAQLADVPKLRSGPRELTFADEASLPRVRALLDALPPPPDILDAHVWFGEAVWFKEDEDEEKEQE